MKFAFSTAGSSDIGNALAHAKAAGFDGIELNGPVQNAKTLAREMGDAGLDICCLTSPATFPNLKRQNAQSADHVKQTIDTARVVGAPTVLISDPRDINTSPQAFSDWLKPLGEYAADAKVTLVVENGSTLRSAPQLWALVDQIELASVAVCWNMQNGARAGQLPAMVVPMLNSKIQYARVSDSPVDDGNFPMAEKFIHLLRGVGYGRYVTIHAARDVAQATHALKTFRRWDQRLKVSDVEAAFAETGKAK